MTVEFDCAVCQRHVVKRRSPANIKGPIRFCGQRCHGIARRGTGAGLAPNHTVTCEVCGVVANVYRAPTARKPRYCSLKCTGLSQRGNRNSSFRSGTHVLQNGYRVVLMPDDAESDSRGYVYEHRLIARTIVGRPLTPREVVHHINGIKTDNSKTNLTIFASQAEHIRHHMRTAQWTFRE